MLSNVCNHLITLKHTDKVYRFISMKDLYYYNLAKLEQQGDTVSAELQKCKEEIKERDGK